MANINQSTRIQCTDALKRKALQAVIDLKEDNPTLEEEWKRKATAAACKSLGIETRMIELERAKANVREVLAQLADAYENVLNRVTDDAVDSISRDERNAENIFGSSSWSLQSELSPHIDAHLKNIMESDPVGRRILFLEAQREEIWEAMLLVSNDQQLKQFWDEWHNLVELDTTDAERIALACG